MENITANSGALAELRGVKFPAPDADFFANFLPEFLFALAIGITAWWAVAHYGKLFSQIEIWERRPKTAAERAIASIRGLENDSEAFAEELWKILRTYLSERYGNPFFPNMTVSEAVVAMKDDAAFERLAELARKLEYSPDRQADEKLALKNLAVDFLTERQNG